MIPSIQMQSQQGADANGFRYEALSIFSVTYVSAQFRDESLEISMGVCCEEDEPDQYLPPDVRHLSISFDEHQWAAFRSYVDSHFAIDNPE